MTCPISVANHTRLHRLRQSLACCFPRCNLILGDLGRSNEGGGKRWEGGMVGNKDGRTHILISNFKLKTLYSTVKAAVWSSTPFCLTVQRFLGKNNYHFVICILMTVNGNAKMATNIFSHNIFLWNVVLRAIS